MRPSVVTLSLLFLVIHLAIAALVPLFDDEAYYALWARHLALGYYDHPPMIAYMIRMGTSLLGETPFGIRLFPVISFIGSGYLVGDLVRRLSDGDADMPLLAVAFYHLSLPVFALGSFATPDAPSTLFWAAAHWAAFRAIDSPPNSPPSMLWWCLTGLCLGLGGLSKFTNAFLALGLLAYLIGTSKGRTYLLTPLPYLALATTFLPLLPYLVWNIENDWLGIERQGERVFASGLSIRSLGEYAGLLLLAPTPLVTWFALRALKTAPRKTALLLWGSGPLLLYFAYHATHSQIQANWIVPIQLFFAVHASFGIAQTPSPRRWAKATLVTAAVLSIASFATFFNPVIPIGTSDNPPNQTRGWPATEAAIAETLLSTGAQWIATRDYARTGSLALRFPNVPVWSVTQVQRYGFRGAFPSRLCSAPGLLIERAGRSEVTSEAARRFFEDVGQTHLALRSQHGTVLMRYHLTPVRHLKSRELCLNQPDELQ